MKAGGAALLAAAFAPHAAAGPASAYYLASGDRIFAVQGSSVLWNQPTFYSGLEYPIAVASTVRTTGFFFGAPGGEYDPATGLPTGNPCPHPGLNDFNDGTTDGETVYAVQFNSGRVYACNANWGSPVLLFTLSRAEDALSITYDPTNDSLWIAGWTSRIVENYSLSGTLNSSFATPWGRIIGLGLDHASGTLWMGTQTTYGTYYEYSKSGTQLSSETYPALSGINTAGGEFAFVPGTPCEADFNGDNQVDFFDYLDFVAAFDAEDAAADFNGDNQVDFFDYLDFAAAFDEGCV
jgi:hypothetical protein